MRDGRPISAAFNAPLAGAFFALEEVVGTFSAASFAPVVVASVTAAVVSRAVFGNHPAFAIPREYGYAHASEIVLLYPLLGIVIGVVAAFFVRAYFWRPSSRRNCGIAGITDSRMADSRGWRTARRCSRVSVRRRHRRIWSSRHSHGHLRAHGVVRPCGTRARQDPRDIAHAQQRRLRRSVHSFAVHRRGDGRCVRGSGRNRDAVARTASGGVRARRDGGDDRRRDRCANYGDPARVRDDERLRDRAAAHAHGRHLTRRRAPAAARFAVQRLAAQTGESIEQGTDRDVLADLHVYDAYERSPQLILESAPADEIMSHLGQTDQTYFPVVDDYGGLVGVITAVELGLLARDQRDLGRLVVAGDLARPTETVSPGDSLLEAIRRMGVRGAASIPVVDARSKRLLGLLSRAHLLNLYERAVSTRGEQ